MRSSFLVFPMLTCCAEPDLVRILDGYGSGWDLVDAPRGGLADLDRVSGRSARLRVGSVLAPDAMDPPLDANDAGAVLLGGSPRARWTSLDHVAVPDDFDSLAMFTAFAHTERALDAFRAAGVRGRAVDPVEVHYLPDLANSGLATSDNAYYFVPADAVLLLAPIALQDVPLAMNPGVLAHELAHRVAYWDLWEGRRLAVYDAFRAGHIDDPHARESMFLTAALDEGVADYFGAVISDDPAFVGASVGDQQVARDVSVSRTYQAAWIGGTSVYYSSDGRYDPYHLGTVVASALWAVGEALGHDAVCAAIVESQRDLAPRAQALALDHADLEVEVAARLGPAACAVFAATYHELWDAFSEVCP